MNDTVITYAIYLAIAVPITIWVARTLHKNGRIFLVSCFKDNEELADSVNHLLVVGFYLVNLGFVTLYLKLDNLVQGSTGIFEALSTKIGTVLLVLGGMHFLNMVVLSKLRNPDDKPNPHPQPPQIPLPIGANPRPEWRDELKK
ncbi:MAG: hypothetical protein NWT08_05945 [Akkermansiaceae bacterium]|jgi:hypothetical protein|nr:hypothetical protein [Akkermansiaceae bacterium]MDP4645793.1 hypothetical protein [Akkermansiaceae bacterium]MDP4720096.1 hypothetical protein [Akkermansiaceae bacterium]MDP4779034.1 hypothetical protein [Akkermansiaceae bacterium]MDP4847962.1 hypothetical protein [Akkermansiaceae bacterium]